MWLNNELRYCSYTTNKFSPQELIFKNIRTSDVQIIQINSVLKNPEHRHLSQFWVQIIQINSVLKNQLTHELAL